MRALGILRRCIYYSRWFYALLAFVCLLSVTAEILDILDPGENLAIDVLAGGIDRGGKLPEAGPAWRNSEHREREHSRHAGLEATQIYGTHRDIDLVAEAIRKAEEKRLARQRKQLDLGCGRG